MAKSYTDDEFIAVFWSRVRKSDDPNGCWEWTGALAVKGYGQITRKQVSMTTHRVAWELTHGAIPEGMCVLHRCDNRACVRPDHLFLGSIADNNLDMHQKHRHSLKRAKGADHGLARLTEEQVREMRRLYRPGSREYGTYALARLFGVSQHNVYLIVTQQSWTHIK